jgi:hypothetical protein
MLNAISEVEAPVGWPTDDGGGEGNGQMGGGGGEWGEVEAGRKRRKGKL